jgi:L-serine dehydratase
MDGDIKEALIEYDPKGSLATTHRSQGSDMGLTGGFLGWEIYDERLKDYTRIIDDSRLKIRTVIRDYGATHPNTYKLTLKNSKENLEMTAISTGGGMIEVVELNGIKMSIAGDYFETLIFTNQTHDVVNFLKKRIQADYIKSLSGKNNHIVEIKAQHFLGEEIFQQLRSAFDIQKIKELKPVVPVLSRKGMAVPFITYEEMIEYNKDKDLDLWELAIYYESARGKLTYNDVFERMRDIVKIIKKSVQEGLKGTEYEDRILGIQSGAFKKMMKKKKLLDTGMLNVIILYVTALMEVKSSMGVIVAAPTAGSCGGLPGACLGAASSLGVPEEEIVKAMLAAGLIGAFISSGATFLAEVGGCQAECGAGSGMAAAALVTLKNGSLKQCVDAASMALQNIFGMVCDPVANRVEVPCLGKNVMAASNALCCANMALANYDAVLPLDEVIEAMDKVGKSLPYELRCTALGGLSITKTSKEIEKKLCP